MKHTLPSPSLLASALFVSSLLIFGSCSGGDNKDPLVTFFDSGIPDATVVPDAAPCLQTVCNGVCVDTSKDSLNCGGCDMACTSAGQLCSGSLPCECPPDFVPGQVGGGGFDQVMSQGNAYFAIAAQLGSPLTVVSVVYDLTLETGTEYDFANAISGLTPPGAIAGYDVDVNNFTAKTPYGSTEGTIIFDEICAGGVSGTMSNVVFAEVAGITNPTPVPNGCTMSYETITFAIGSCDQTGPDGGVPPSGVGPDAMPSN